MGIVQRQYLEVFIQWLTHMSLLEQSALYLGTKAAIKNTVKIGSGLCA